MEFRRSRSAPTNAFAERGESLRRRVAAAAKALSDRGIRPTVTRVRAALGGGSPNDLAPALKRWKESSGAAASVPDGDAAPSIPIQIADLAHELWQRANASAVLELKGGPAARSTAARTDESESLRSQLSGLRDQLQRESLAFGEQRAQSARYEAMAHSALTRADEAEARERKHVRDLGAARQRIAELEATVNQLREPTAVKTSRFPRRRKPKSFQSRPTAKRTSKQRPKSPRNRSFQKRQPRIKAKKKRPTTTGRRR